MRRSSTGQLDADAQEPEDGVNQVMVEVQALARLGDKQELLGGTVAADAVAAEDLGRAKDGDEALGDPVVAGDLLGPGLLVLLRARHVGHGPAGVERHLEGGLLDPLGSPLGEDAKVLQQHKTWGLCPQTPRIYRFTATGTPARIGLLPRRIGLRWEPTRAPWQCHTAQAVLFGARPGFLVPVAPRR